MNIENKRKGRCMKRKQVKTIALIAHDHKKAEMVNWALKNKEKLMKFELCGTGTTAKLVHIHAD